MTGPESLPKDGETLPRSGFVSVVGRPNAGKSTLINQMVGNKVSIVTPSAQTTRNVVRGIVSEPRGQAIFLDTPGIHKPLHRMNERMMRTMIGSLDHVDVVLLIVDATASPGGGDRFALEMVSKLATKKFLILNKIDRLQKRKLLPLISSYGVRGRFDQIVPISALEGDGTGLLKDLIFENLPEGPLYYPTDQISDQPERFLVGEIVREKLILATREELPHATAVAIERFEEDATPIRIYASIYVERESQKIIVIGKGGQLLKQAGSGARADIEALLGRHVHLELHVKVRRKWRDDEQVLETLGL